MKRKTTIKWGVAMAVIIAIACYLRIKRWDAWFGNPIEPSYITVTEPGRIQLTFGNDGETSRNISWQGGKSINKAALHIVKQGSADTLHYTARGRKFLSTGGATISYHASLKDLSEGTYYYNVSVGEKQSDWYHFDVSTHNDAFSFVYLGDIQDTVNGMTKDFIKNIHHQKRDAAFWILGGDVIERPHDQYWNEYFTSMDSVSQTVPIIAVPGNHEYLKGVSRKLEKRFIYTYSYFVQSEYAGHAVYDTRYGNTAIITLDSNRDFWTLLSQKKWLKEALERSKDAEWKVVVLHHPIYSIRGKMNNLVVRTMFNSLIQEYGVDLVLQGHEHGYARMINKDDDDDNNLTTPIYIVGQSSPKDYKLYFNDKYDRFGAGMRFYQVINVNLDTLSIKTYTDTNELYDDICLIKDENKITIIDAGKNIPEQILINTRTKKVKKGKTEEYQNEIEEWLTK